MNGYNGTNKLILFPVLMLGIAFLLSGIADGIRIADRLSERFGWKKNVVTKCINWIIGILTIVLSFASATIISVFCYKYFGMNIFMF